MKSLLITLSLFVLALIMPEMNKAQTYDHPISIVYDVNKERYLISNVNSGQILSFDSNKQLTVFVGSGLTNPRGMVIFNNVLYVVDITFVKGFNLSDGTEVLNYAVPTSQKLTYITADTDGFLYILDDTKYTLYFYNVIDTTQKSPPVLLSNSSLYTNGITYYKNKLYITVFWKPAGIVIFDLNDFSTKPYEYTSNNFFYGITPDGKGKFYVSSWEDMSNPTGQGKILKFDPDTPNTLEEIATGYNGPSGIYYNPYSNEIAIPNYFTDDIAFIKLINSVKINESEDSYASLYQNQSGSELIIKFKGDSRYNIQLYNFLGQSVSNNQVPEGASEYKVNISNLESGLYFVRLGNSMQNSFYKILVSH
jgi:hypothetical protein